jgi:hypothetical protein
MNEDSDRSDLSLPVSELLEIDRICREFEAAWKAGEQPKVEEFVGAAQEPQRSQLLKELSVLQAELQDSSGPSSTKKTAADKPPHAKPSLHEFTRRLIESGLMTADEYQAFCQALPPERQPQTAEQLAQELYHRGKLTKFQTQAVYQGKTRGLVVGNYVVLDKIGQGGWASSTRRSTGR